MVKYRLAGIGGSSVLSGLCSGMVRGFDHRLQFLAGVEGDDAPGGDRNFFPGFRIAPGTLRFFAQLKIAEAGELHAVAGFERDSDLLEKALDHVLGFAFVKARSEERRVGIEWM